MVFKGKKFVFLGFGGFILSEGLCYNAAPILRGVE